MLGGRGFEPAALVDAPQPAYIEAYDRKYGTGLYPDFPRPSADFTDKEESEIFNLFRENFANMGNWDNYAVNWFVNGTVGSLYPNDSDIETKFQGYFKKVFAGTDDVATAKRCSRKRISTAPSRKR